MVFVTCTVHVHNIHDTDANNFYKDKSLKQYKDRLTVTVFGMEPVFFSFI